MHMGARSKKCFFAYKKIFVGPLTGVTLLTDASGNATYTVQWPTSTEMSITASLAGYVDATYTFNSDGMADSTIHFSLAQIPEPDTILAAVNWVGPDAYQLDLWSVSPDCSVSWDNFRCDYDITGIVTMMYDATFSTTPEIIWYQGDFANDGSAKQLIYVHNFDVGFSHTEYYHAFSYLPDAGLSLTIFTQSGSIVIVAPIDADEIDDLIR